MKGPCLKAAPGLALGAGVGLDFRLGVLVEGAQDEPALGAIVLHHLQLGEDPRPAGDYPTHPDELVQVELPAKAKTVLSSWLVRTLKT